MCQIRPFLLLDSLHDSHRRLTQTSPGDPRLESRKSLTWGFVARSKPQWHGTCIDLRIGLEPWISIFMAHRDRSMNIIYLYLLYFDVKKCNTKRPTMAIGNTLGAS